MIFIYILAFIGLVTVLTLLLSFFSKVNNTRDYREFDTYHDDCYCTVCKKETAQIIRSALHPQSYFSMIKECRECGSRSYDGDDYF
jgi:hypothetical protein